MKLNNLRSVVYGALRQYKGLADDKIERHIGRLIPERDLLALVVGHNGEGNRAAWLIHRVHGPMEIAFTGVRSSAPPEPESVDSRDFWN